MNGRDAVTNWVFDLPHAQAINKARLEHLDSLGLPLEGRSVLEVGAGIGLLTSFFEERQCIIHSTDGRPGNVEENLRRHPWRDGSVEAVDLAIPGGHRHLPDFEIVFCYGALYHLGDPALAISDLAQKCQSLFLLSTCVSPEDDGQVHPEFEHPAIDQSLHGVGCRPARDWLRSKLTEQYPYVYATRTQPAHHDYPTEWPAVPGETGLVRAVFVASRTVLNLPALLPKLSDKQERLK